MTISYETLFLSLLLGANLCCPTIALGVQSSLRRVNSERRMEGEELVALPDCTDTSETFSVVVESDANHNDEDEVTRNCVWLEQNLKSHGYLCDRFDISSLCRRTCGVCEATLEAMELLEKCENEKGEVVSYGQEYVSCQWIKEHFDENPDACSTTSVALSCPVVCDFYDLPSCVKVDPLTTTGRKKEDTFE